MGETRLQNQFEIYCVKGKEKKKKPKQQQQQKPSATQEMNF